VRASHARAVIVTTDFETGRLAVTRAERPRRAHVLDTPIHADAIVRASGGQVFVVNRLGGDNVQVLDPRRLTTRLQCSTGTRSNPHDIAVVAPTKAYVTRHGEPDLWIVDPSARSCDRFRIGRIDLGAFADADGIPEMNQLAVVGSRLFVTLERLDRLHGFDPAREGALAVVDTTADAVEAIVPLLATHPFGDASGLPRDPASGALLVNLAGRFARVGDGGIQRVDPATLVAEPGFLLSEDAAGGSITDFVLVSAARGYAIVFVPGDPPRNVVVAFDPVAGVVTRRLLTRPTYLPDLALAPDGLLWLADQSLPAPGIRIFDPRTDTQLTRRALPLGLPPFAIAFLP
jgi:hypothetical protein